MDFNDLIPELLVSNISVSEEFYVEALGFQVAFRREGFVFLTFNNSQLMITQLKPDSWVNGKISAPFGQGINLTFKVSQPWLEQLVIQSAHVFLPKQVEKYQTGDTETTVRQTIIKDSDGYLIRFICQSVV
ncbi:hypothetical protein NDM58_004622 [Vibrio parahaemolyticus]|nr:hypothetical protein [Vibrio parahaemolyticus]